MIRRASTILLVSLLLVSVLALGAFGASKNKKGDQSAYGPYLGGKLVDQTTIYSFPDESMRSSGPAVSGGSKPVGSMAATAVAGTGPGVTFGYSYYEYQHNCSMGRMIETGPHSGETGNTFVHMGWMWLDGPTVSGTNRAYAYNAYNTNNAEFVAGSQGYILQDTLNEFAGYVNTDVTPDNRAIIGGHSRNTTIGQCYSSEMRFDDGPGYCNFPAIVRVPDSVQDYDQKPGVPDEYAIWPKFFFQFGTDTVLHVASQVSEANDQNVSALMYFRRPGFEGSPDYEWDYPPYVFDSVADIAQDVIGQRNGNKVCLVWFAALPYQEPWCDTCSGYSIYGGRLSQQDNDIYYQQSTNQGVNWLPKVNLTKVPIGEKAYKAFGDASVAYDAAENLHIIWHACPWEADLCVDEGGGCWAADFYLDNARLFHWSENVPHIRPIADQVYADGGPDSCGAPAWALRIAKMTLSECDGKLYAIWTQFNDPKEDVIDDCAEWAYTESWYGSANGDIMLSVSADLGMTWDYRRNLTNTYTPHCLPGDCSNDYWASMSRTGRIALATEDWSGADVIDPTTGVVTPGGTVTGNYYLDIQYANDLDAGGAIQTEGTWTWNPFNWFRIPCVEPIPMPIWSSDWQSLGDPNYCKPGEQLDTVLMMENIGNTALTYTMSVVYDSGAATGWLYCSSTGGTIPSGLDGQEYVDLTLNQNLMTAYGNYFAHLQIEGPGVKGLPFEIPIELIIADTIIQPKWDSVTTGLTWLVAGTHGNYGRAGAEGLGLDFWKSGDCDSNATYYIYDGSPFIGQMVDGEPEFIANVWGGSWLGDGCFRPQGGETPARLCPLEESDANVFHSGVMTDTDSTIAMSRVFVAPTNNNSFVIVYTKVWSWDGAAHNGLILGEGVDFDIPADLNYAGYGDSSVDANIGYVDGARNLLYSQGYEAYGTGNDTTYRGGRECNPQDFDDTYNDLRWGGNAFLESYLNGSLRKTAPDRGVVGTRDTLQGEYSWEYDALWEELTYTTGLSTTSKQYDLHHAMAFEVGFDLGATDVYEVVQVFASIQQGTQADFLAAIDAGKAWYLAHGGMALFADVDDQPGVIDYCAFDESCCDAMGDFYDWDSNAGIFGIWDIQNFISWLWPDPELPTPLGPSCPEEADVVGTTEPNQPPAPPDGIVDVKDLNRMIRYNLFYEWVEYWPSCPE